MPRLGIQARAALAAAISAAIAFGIGGFLFRQQLHRELLAHEEAAVTAALMPLATDTIEDVIVIRETGWIVISGEGELRSWGPGIDALMGAKPGAGNPPVPGELEPLLKHQFPPNTISKHTLTLGPTRDGSTSRLTGRSVDAVCAGFVLSAESMHPFGTTDRGTFCQIVLPWEADAAAATVDRFVALGMLLTALIVGGIGWLVTGMALRPVRSISRQMAEITDLRSERRVPVPASADAIAELAVTVNRTLERLESAAERQRRFIADASHELRSPITNLGRALEVALTYPERARWREVVEDANTETIRLRALVDDLLTLARLEQSHAPQARRVDLTALVHEQVTRRGSMFVALSTEPVVVLADPALLDRILRNLLDNAERHARSKVEVGVSEDGAGEVTLTVTNDGPSIPDDERDNIFVPFTRLDDARSRHAGGTGLGLAIVREIAVLHGGGAKAAENPDGATFIVTLKSKPVEVADGHARAEPGRSDAAGLQ